MSTLGPVPAVVAAAESLSPTIVPIVVVGVFVLVVSTILVVAFARPGGPDPADIAVAYEHAWDRLDFPTLWNLSSPRMRDGRSQAQFVRDKQAAYGREPGLQRLVRSVRPERVDVSGPVARVVTRLELADGESVMDEMLLEQVGSVWQVAEYHIASGRNTGPTA